MQKLPTTQVGFPARNDYAFLSIVHPCTMERTSFVYARNIVSDITSGIHAASVSLEPMKIRTS